MRHEAPNLPSGGGDEATRLPLVRGNRTWWLSPATLVGLCAPIADDEVFDLPHFVFGSRQTPIDILLVEDNPGGVDLTRDALEDGKIRDTLHTVDNGEKTMRFLRRETRCSEAPGPDLVLLDLNLPRRDGREALAEIETDPDPRSILVVIVTASSAEADALKSYNPHANCYITRPIDLHQFLGIVKSIEHFWLAIVVLPPNGGRRR